jgi:hypothetical protein
MPMVVRVERVNGEIVTSERLSESLVQVCAGEAVVGFVEAAGPIFVALFGPRYDRAVEVAQSLSFDAAAAGLLSHARMVAALSGELAPRRAAPKTQPKSRFRPNADQAAS